MKVAISLQEGLLDRADEAAQQIGVSRSKLFSLAAEEFLERRHQEEVLKALNKVYTNDPQSEQRRLAKQARSRFASASRGQW